MPDYRTRYLIAEYCDGPFYMGWHLYLRESRDAHQTNYDGDWGWIRWSPSQELQSSRTGADLHPCRAVFDVLGIKGSLLGGGGDETAIGRFAAAHAMLGSTIAGKPRGCFEVAIDEWERMNLRNKLAEPQETTR